jgi:hypothetical protein
MCQACDHPERAALEQDIRAGMPPRLAGPKYGLSPAGVYQHALRHIASSDAQATSASMKPRQVDVEMTLAPENIESIDCQDHECSCTLARMSGYQLLCYAWGLATTRDKERFCAETRSYDVPF